MRNYKRNWQALKLVPNFNHKQWRQDLGAFIKNKNYWDFAYVTKSKSIGSKPDEKGIKVFTIYSNSNASCDVYYRNQNEILKSTYPEIVKEYLKERM